MMVITVAGRGAAPPRHRAARHLRHASRWRGGDDRRAPCPTPPRSRGTWRSSTSSRSSGRRGRIVVDTFVRLLGIALFGLLAWQCARYGMHYCGARGRCRSRCRSPCSGSPYVIAFSCVVRPVVLVMHNLLSSRQGDDQAVSPAADRHPGRVSCLLVLLVSSMPVAFAMAIVGIVGFRGRRDARRPRSAWLAADLLRHLLLLQPDGDPAVRVHGADGLSLGHQPAALRRGLPLAGRPARRPGHGHRGRLHRLRGHLRLGPRDRGHHGARWPCRR